MDHPAPVDLRVMALPAREVVLVENLGTSWAPKAHCLPFGIRHQEFRCACPRRDRALVNALYSFSLDRNELGRIRVQCRVEAWREPSLRKIRDLRFKIVAAQMLGLACEGAWWGKRRR
jgi:hypothetical protein